MKLRTISHSSATGCAWFGSNHLVTVGNDKTAKYWDITTGEQTSMFAFGERAEQVLVHQGIAYVGQADGNVTNSLGHSFQSQMGRITEMAVSGGSLAVGGVGVGEDGVTFCQVAVMSLDGTIKWRAQTGGIVYALEFNPEGYFLFTGEGNGVVARRSSETGVVLNSRGSFTNSIVDMRYYQSRLWVGQLNTSTQVPSLWFIDEISLQHVGSIGYPFPSGVWSLGLNSSGALLGVTGNRNELMVFDHMRAELIYANPRASIGKKLVWNPTRPDMFAVCLSDGTIEIHDLQPEEAPTEVPPPPTPTKPKKGRRR